MIVTCGAKDAIYDAMEAVLNPGDEAILLTPAWVSYEPCVQIAGGKIVQHAVNTRTFQLDDSLLERVNAKTKMIVVNSPSNPSGAVFEKPSMQLVADLCEDHDIYAMSDEIYEKLVYDKVHLSLAALGDMAHRTITINGFSKSYAMTGWRLGYAVAPIEIIRRCPRCSNTRSARQPRLRCGVQWQRSKGTSDVLRRCELSLTGEENTSFLS